MHGEIHFYASSLIQCNLDLQIGINCYQGRRQGVCLGGATYFATAAPALKKSLSGGGGGGGGVLRHIFFFSTKFFWAKMFIMG